MGEYFDTVTKPRIKKVVYAPDWKDGKLQQRDSGVSQIIKYMRLESYEDALSNIDVYKRQALPQSEQVSSPRPSTPPWPSSWPA